MRFNAAGVTGIIEEEHRDGGFVVRYGVSVLEYFRPVARKGIVGPAG